MKPLSYWRWFWRGRNGQAGWKKFFNLWLLLHATVGMLMSWLLPLSLQTAAQAVLLPLAGIFIGLSFAWVGNAQAVLQSTELERLYEQHPGGFENYAYSFQSAILAILITLVAWSFAALGILDEPCFWSCPAITYDAAGALLFFLASISLRECWHVVMGAQLLLLTQRHIRKLDDEP